MEIKPAKNIWNHYNRNEVSQDGITMELIMSSIADVLAGYHISRSAQILLEDLNYLKVNKEKKTFTITKKGKLILAHELHERYHRRVKTYHKIIDPNSGV